MGGKLPSSVFLEWERLQMPLLCCVFFLTLFFPSDVFGADFKVQRGTTTLTGASTTLTAGVDYDAPSASTSAFIRITNAHHTGAGDANNTPTQYANEVTAYVTNPSNIMNSVTFGRPAGVASTTRVSWEIVEYIGAAGGDNEIVVRTQSFVSYGVSAVNATGSATSTIADDNDVAVFITGQMNTFGDELNYDSGQSTAEWNASTNEPVFTIGENSGSDVRVSYAVVEFTGKNWAVQRSEHTYDSANTTETESITALGSLSRAFVHTQKRVTSIACSLAEFGHEVWLSSVGAVSYRISSIGANDPNDHVSVAWIIENTQTGTGAMTVTRSNGTSQNGTAPLTLSISIGATLADITNASLFVNTRGSSSASVGFPGPIVGATIASTTHYELWRSNTGDEVTYRTEVVEWPTANLRLEQNYYRLYVDNDALDPTDPWPAGASDLGENAALTGADEPLGISERLRIRMSLKAMNATFPADTRAFRLQYGPMTTTCSAIGGEEWQTLGGVASTTLWRGYNAPGTVDGTLLSGEPPTAGDLNLSVSDVAGTLEETNDTGTNTYAVSAGEDIEYDWVVEQNGAAAGTYYCFRMIETDGTLLSTYNYYPQVRTAPFAPRTQNWRWYADETSVTPTSTLAAENAAPADIVNEEPLKLRITVLETENVVGVNVRFKLQYSEYSDFSVVADVAATSTCSATSTWCYADGGGADNAFIASSTLSDAENCIASVGDGCGSHNESPLFKTGHTHQNGAAAEYEFTIKPAGPRVNRVYYFRLFDVGNNASVTPAVGESYPSLVTEGSNLIFGMEGLPASTVVEGVTLDIDTTPTSIPFGELTSGSVIEGAHRLSVDTNATQGYQILMMMTGDFMTSGGAIVEQITGTNASPSSWAAGCAAIAPSCLGYHTSDDTLDQGSTRFSALDTYARFSTTTPEEVSYSSQPIIGDTTDIVFRILARELQAAGLYETNIMYISVPIF